MCSSFLQESLLLVEASKIGPPAAFYSIQLSLLALAKWKIKPSDGHTLFYLISNDMGALTRRIRKKGNTINTIKLLSIETASTYVSQSFSGR